MSIGLPLISHAEVVSSNQAYGEVYLVQHYVMNVVSDLRQVGGFTLGTLVYSTNKTDRHDIHVANIFLKVTFNTITLTLTLKVSKSP